MASSHSSAIPAANLSGKGNEELGQPVIRPGLPQGLPVWPDRRRDFSCSPNYGGMKAPVDSALDTREDAPANCVPSRRPLEFTLALWGDAGSSGKKGVCGGGGGPTGAPSNPARVGSGADFHQTRCAFLARLPSCPLSETALGFSAHRSMPARTLKLWSRAGSTGEAPRHGSKLRTR